MLTADESSGGASLILPTLYDDAQRAVRGFQRLKSWSRAVRDGNAAPRKQSSSGANS
jgi:hypothetical protein